MELPPMSMPFSSDGPLERAPRDEPREEPTGDFGGFELPGFQLLDDPSKQKLNLPSFEEYSRGPKKPVPKTTTYSSKLPSINQGRSVYDDLPEEEEKGLLERVVFGITIGGIAFLIFVEIFINTPVFQQIKPFILKIMPN